jgi:hypothetical protein
MRIDIVCFEVSIYISDHPSLRVSPPDFRRGTPQGGDVKE